jgi:hypothetical protein
MKFDISTLRSSNPWVLYRLRDRIQVDPEYQRLSDIWTLEKRQLLIDTILNDFDVPKLYLHKFRAPLKVGKSAYDYAIIDGKQRLEALWKFIDGEIALADDFEYFKDPKVKAAGLKYSDLGKTYPDLKVQFDGFTLATILIETDEIEVIEEMFSRLNEAAALSAPEKRNAFGGPLPGCIRGLARRAFFQGKLPFPNKRYRHYDLATKFLLVEKMGCVVDTKKAYLDEFVRAQSGEPRTKKIGYAANAEYVVDSMARVFVGHDPLLRQVGMVMLYYHLFRLAHRDGWAGKITRRKLLDFDQKLASNRKRAEKNLVKATYDMIEFDKYAQSPNDAYAIRFRLSVLLWRAFGRRVSVDDL